MKSDITCLIPFYNENQRLIDTLKIITKVKGINKIICINDGSQDNSAILLKKFFPKIDLISFTNNQGKTETIRQGLKSVKTKYTLLLDSDLKNLDAKEIEKALSMKYLKIPESVRKIEYCYKTKDKTPKYFLVDYPAYNFKYDNFRFFVIEDEIATQFDIKNVTRYRDGGTTIIDVIDKIGVEHKFFSPTTLPEKTLYEKWDEIELIPTTKHEEQKLVELLNLDLEATDI